MKRNNLTTAVVAGLAGMAGIVNLAGAVDLNPDGLGQVLIYPYYTVNGGNTTLISIVNTTAAGKGVKVRFLEGYDSREVLDFNLYLSPFDVWTAGVFDTSTTGKGAAGLVTNDESCTAPKIKTNTGLPKDTLGRRFAEFRNYAYVSPSDGGPTSIARTREGHLEMIEMVEVLPSSTLTAITHVSGVPANCDAVQTPNVAHFGPPRGGLFGAGSIVNAAQGVMNAYNADAIEGFYTLGDTALYSGTSSTIPSLAQAATSPGVAVAHVFTGNGNLVSSTYAGNNKIDAVSAVLNVNHIYNEFEMEAVAGAESEWVVTFPTKRYYVDPAIVGLLPVQPFTKVFTKDYSCVVVGLSYYDREEGTVVGTVDFSPPPVTPPSSLCFESQVIPFLKAASAPIDPVTKNVISSIFGSVLTTNVDTRASGIEAGWLNLDLDTAGELHTMRASVDGDVYHGLPATGFLATNYTNLNVTPGVLANYSGLYRHRASRNCTNAQGAQGACS